MTEGRLKEMDDSDWKVDPTVGIGNGTGAAVGGGSGNGASGGSGSGGRGGGNGGSSGGSGGGQTAVAVKERKQLFRLGGSYDGDSIRSEILQDRCVQRVSASHRAVVCG